MVNGYLGIIIIKADEYCKMNSSLLRIEKYFFYFYNSISNRNRLQ